MAAAWLSLDGTNVHSYCGADATETPVAAMDDTDEWQHWVDDRPHWLILDLGAVYDLTKIKGRSHQSGADPTDVDVYVSTAPDGGWVLVVANITDWQDNDLENEHAFATERGRYVKIEIIATENVDHYMKFGSNAGWGDGRPFIDLYGELAPTEHAPTDTAGAGDTDDVTFEVGKNLADDANASDAPKFDASKSLADTAKASDAPKFEAGKPLSDTAKASDSVTFDQIHPFDASDTAKASDDISKLDVGKSLSDTAKASDAPKFNAGKPLSDTAKASDAPKFEAEKSLADTAKASDAAPKFDAGKALFDTAKASDSVTFHVIYGISDTAKAIDSLNYEAGLNLEDAAKASDLFSSLTHGRTESTSCSTFSIIAESGTVTLYVPIWGGETYKLQKDLQSFNFWSGNFSIHDKGINSEPIVLVGTEIAPQTVAYEHIVFTSKFVDIRAMARNNEEVTINGLGDCIDAVYVIKSFSTKTMRKKDARTWTLILEYVRDA